MSRFKLLPEAPSPEPVFGGLTVTPSLPADSFGVFVGAGFVSVGTGVAVFAGSVGVAVGVCVFNFRCVVDVAVELADTRLPPTTHRRRLDRVKHAAMMATPLELRQRDQRRPV